MTFIPADTFSLSLFLLILFFVVVCLIKGVYVANLRMRGPALPRALKVSLAVGLWLALASTLVVSGFLIEQPFPRVILFFGFSNILGVILALSPAGEWLAEGLSLQLLIGFQAFRLPLEWVLHSWVAQGTIPESMTWTGSNFDILSGIFAVIAAVLVNRVRAIAWVFNLLGTLLLLNVMRVAIMSSPFEWAWGVKPPLLLAFYFPYALIVPICVAGALGGHIVLTRALLRPR